MPLPSTSICSAQESESAGVAIFTFCPTLLVFVVPAGVEHRPSAPDGASILMFEPTGTLTVGDRHDPVPAHVDVTAGRPAPPPR